MPNPSPLRYPGGKHRLAGFIQLAIQNLNMPDCTYVEPFAGGAGVALSLLLDGTVNRIVINDYDKAIYSFWRAVRQEPTSLIDLIQNTPSSKINIYCEDARAVSFLQHILSSNLHVNLDLYMSFVDINLGWPNYVQLVEKGIPEFKNNMIVLDGDVQQMDEYAAKAARTVQNAGNIIFLPLVIEKGIFALLKNHEAFLRFQEAFSRVPGFTYDVCFNSWPLDVSSYNTNDFKKWYSYAESTLGDTTILFDFWCSEHQDNISTFVERFVDVFNRLAERNSVDAIPTITHNDNGENVAIPQAEV